jgi:hypothetical protein
MDVSSVSSNAQILADYYAQQDALQQETDPSIAQQQDGLNQPQPPQMDPSSTNN